MGFFPITVLFCFLGKCAPLMIMLNYKGNSKKSDEKILRIEIKSRKIVNQFPLSHIIFKGEIHQTLVLFGFNSRD